MASIEDIGIDLGSSNVVIYARNRGVVFSEPAVVAYDEDSNSIIAIGSDAYRMTGRLPGSIRVERPIENGAIKNSDMLSIMLTHFVQRVIGRRVFSRPRAVISVSANVNELETRQLILRMLEAGTRRTQVLPRPLAAAVGANVKVLSHVGHMVIDIGASNSHAGVLSGGQVVQDNTAIVGGDAFTEAIEKRVRLKYNLLIGRRTAEDIKQALGTVRDMGESELTLPVAGRNLITGLPKQIDIGRAEVTEAMEEPMRQMLEGIRGLIEDLAPELANDVYENGIVLTGGGALLKGLQEVISEDLKVTCRTAEQPQDCVAVGCGHVLERMDELGALLGDPRRRAKG